MKLGPGAKTVLMLAGLVIFVGGLYLAAPLLVPLVTAVFITVVSLPVVRWLMARRVPRWGAILLAVLLDLVVLTGFAGLVGGSLNEFNHRVPYYQARLGALTDETTTWLIQHGVRVDAERIRSALDAERLGGLVTDWLAPPEAEPSSAGRGFQLMSIVTSFFERLTQVASQAFLVALLVLFMLFEAGPWRMKMAYVLHSPTQDLPRFANAAREVQTYLVVKSGLSVVTGALCGTWVAVCGVDFPLLWGLLAFLLNYIPTLGMFIATIPPVAVALIQFGPGSALLVLAGYGVVNFTLGNVVEPRIMGRALGLSPLVVFLSMVFWGWLWGPIGALLAVPLTMVIKILMANTEDLRWAAVLLGSAEWFAEKRQEWEDPFEAEKRRSQTPPPPAAEGQGYGEVFPRPPALPSEALLESDAAHAESNPPLHVEDEFGKSGPRAIERPEGERSEPEQETFRSA